MIISWALILKLMGGKKKSAREAPPAPPGSLCAEFVARLELPHHHRWNSQVTWGGHLAALQGRRVTLPHVDGREVNGGFYPPGPALFIRVGTGYTDDPLRRRKKKKTPPNNQLQESNYLPGRKDSQITLLTMQQWTLQKLQCIIVHALYLDRNQLLCKASECTATPESRPAERDILKIELEACKKKKKNSPTKYNISIYLIWNPTQPLKRWGSADEPERPKSRMRTTLLLNCSLAQQRGLLVRVKRYNQPSFQGREMHSGG